MELGRFEFENNPRQGLKYFTAGRLRAAYDTGRCRERGIHGTPLAILMQRHKKLVEYSRDNPEAFKTAVEEAIRWDKANAYNATPIWICSYSMSALQFDGNKAQPVAIQSLIRSKDEWPMLRQEIYNGFESILKK